MQLHSNNQRGLVAAALALWVGACGEPVETPSPEPRSASAALVTSQRLTLAPSMLSPDGVRPTAGAYQNLVDEQHLVGDPRAGTGGAPVTTWGNVVYTESAYPMGFIIDLGQEYDLTEVGVYDTYETGTITFEMGAPGAWVHTLSFESTQWQKWVLKSVQVRTRYVHFARSMKGASDEIVIYGSPAGGPPANLPPTVSAGADVAVVQPATSAALSGTASDIDGAVASVQWTQVSGPSTATLSGATTLSATASNLVLGLYEFELVATDDDGATASDRVKVQVNAAPNGRGVVREFRKDTTPLKTYGYVVYTPPGYDAASNWPIVFFLHGMGQQGNGNSELPKVREEGPLRYIDQENKDYPFVLVAPQTAKDGFWSEWEVENRVDPFFEFILSTYKVDRKRVYLTGLSMGGAGTFNYAGRFPGKLAAAVPVCNGGYGSDQARAQSMVDANLPIWASHGYNDEAILYVATSGWFDKLGKAMASGSSDVMKAYAKTPERHQTAFYRPATASWQWVDGLTALDANGQGPERPYLFTVLNPGTHYIWDTVYKDPKVFNWMLAQSRP
ncbi:dienelactone hydrolase family protein [Myxococcus sp. K15C18031901]|uniref:carboxylesterase family protein n=1 Tax=Myxococcus dinghuensis TaxID=2906761 RepID=UPI0020A7294B|nr:dienelactone hydrolase family protein [Myxococcus dinghuensis]MCP3098245.1 dienelactone hydrolase family protein [Myxococcus dinghuensis]